MREICAWRKRRDKRAKTTSVVGGDGRGDAMKGEERRERKWQKGGRSAAEGGEPRGGGTRGGKRGTASLNEWGDTAN